MNLYIKSFNRPAYLDRCLASINRDVRGVGKVVVLDDGTPRQYLDRILEKHPEVEIRKSREACAKAMVIERLAAGEAVPFPESIPVALWQQCAADEPDYFAVIEDDMWFIGAYDLENARATCLNSQAASVKLCWLGHPIFENIPGVSAGDSHRTIKPVYTRQPWLAHALQFYLTYLQNNHRRAADYIPLSWIRKSYLHGSIYPYLTYSVAGMVVHVDYWREVWSDADVLKFDESVQVRNHLRYIARKRPVFLRPEKECLYQSFLTSAYRRKGLGVHAFDLLKFNRLISEAWFHGKLDPTASLPNDIAREELRHLFVEPVQADCNPQLWAAWQRNLAERYVSQGYNIPFD